MAKAPAKQSLAPPAQSANVSASTGLKVLGGSGLKHFSGYIEEEFQRELAGDAAIRVYRQMADNDPTIGAFLFAIEMILRAAEWNVEPASSADDYSDAFNEAAEAEAQFLRGVYFQDMSHSWEDFIAEANSMLTYGWAYFETIYKFRRGPDEAQPEYRSDFTDGRLGIRKIAIRSQDSRTRWDIQEDGGIAGMWQNPPDKAAEIYIPIGKSLLFRPRQRKGSPEGVSLLRNAYKPYFYLNRLQDVEAVGIERELAGTPIVRVPTALLNSQLEADRAIVQNYIQIARDLRFNTQGGIVIPSDMHEGATGPSNAPLVSVELLKSAGQRTIDAGATIARYQGDMLRSVMAEFMMLGTDGKGSYALSNDKTNMFVRAVQSLGKSISSVFNRYQTPRLWRYNGLDRALMPNLSMGAIGPENLEALGTFLSQISTAGAPLFPDINLEQALRRLAKLPEKSPEVIAEQEAARQEEVDREMAALERPPAAALPPPKGAAKMSPRTLYVRRDVANKAAIVKWAKAQGIESVVDDLHVTIAYSRQPVDWMKMGEPWQSKLEIAEGGPRAMAMFGPEKNVLVLQFASSELQWRHERMRGEGCSWDFDSYEPHITITYQAPGVDPESIEPYRGRIVLGPEIFEEVNENWKDNVRED